MPARNAASVLPEPVGAQIRTCSPRAMAGHPWAWAGVGWPKAWANQRRVGSLDGGGLGATAGTRGGFVGNAFWWGAGRGGVRRDAAVAPPLADGPPPRAPPR